MKNFVFMMALLASVASFSSAFACDAEDEKATVVESNEVSSDDSSSDSSEG
jgi:lipopolysaccharide export system protein LptA